MKEILSTVTSKGQVTIPKDVREQLGISIHDKIAFVIEDDGTVRLQTPEYPTVASLAGAGGSLKHPLSWDEMRDIAREDRHLESKIKQS
ncbi:MAG TPA: AbrB/MazE/SpoVT family DNA-binding domain-containing protein [Ktedonobacterales bacterium]|nr:AbrB/MazE/SpoVT family DNA-binding domain-containing protein [Ktedonobacterales bacterium]